jgi:hypothetical protein
MHPKDEIADPLIDAPNLNAAPFDQQNMSESILKEK